MNHLVDWTTRDTAFIHPEYMDLELLEHPTGAGEVLTGFLVHARRLHEQLKEYKRTLGEQLDRDTKRLIKTRGKPRRSRQGRIALFSLSLGPQRVK